MEQLPAMARAWVTMARSHGAQAHLPIRFLDEVADARAPHTMRER